MSEKSITTLTAHIVTNLCSEPEYQQVQFGVGHDPESPGQVLILVQDGSRITFGQMHISMFFPELQTDNRLLATNNTYIIDSNEADMLLLVRKSESVSLLIHINAQDIRDALGAVRAEEVDRLSKKWESSLTSFKHLGRLGWN